MELKLPGRHNVLNALAATAVAISAGASLTDVRHGLEAMQPVAGRLHPQTSESGAVVIDDTYNANPSSLQAGIDVLTSYAGKHLLVLGDMGELGEDSQEMHAEMGAYARQAGVHELFCLGELSHAAADAFGQGAECFTEKTALINALKQHMAEGMTILIKGSRRMRMEQVVQALVKNGEAKE
ncbi:MAG: hypothetical protein HUJ30_02035 [Gammaproteobacteria bacterium]|nr:hypothetical protein [Gammaproteobacteria bacterium]